jgi:uncharacterized protein with ParB-like and HNH nuclease domain
MKITCLDKEVGQLLSQGYYRVPRFQRPYSWERVQVEEFWNDAITENLSDYFIGNFVVFADKNAFGVVDGQQRLTTITLLLCALRNEFKAEGYLALAAGAHSLIERTDISNDKFYVLRTETSYPYLQEHIQKFDSEPEANPIVGPEEELLKAAYDYLQENIRSIVTGIKKQASLSEPKKKSQIKEELTKVRDKLLGLKLIYTELENDDDAYVIFETLNTRGKDLTLSDMVKSHFSRLLKPKNKGVDIAKDKWSELNEIFEESQVELSVSSFIHHHWLSRYEYLPEKKLFKALRKRINADNAAIFLDDLLTESKIYRQIHEISFRKWSKEEKGIRDSLSAMNLFKIRQQLPLVLSVMRHYDDRKLSIKVVRKVLSAIENFHFVFTAVTSSRSSGGISLMYALAARDLYAATTTQARESVLKQFENKLHSKKPSYEEFEAKFLELKYSSKFTKQKNLVRYILTRAYQHNSTGIAVDPDQMTIEHLGPERPAKASGLKDNDVAALGNLILVDQKLNNKLANKSFAEKVALLKVANVWVDKNVLKASNWGNGEIGRRGKDLSREAYEKVWPI